MTKSRLTKTLWAVAIIATVITTIATLFERSIPNGGEYLSNYDLLRSLKLPLQITMLISGCVSAGSFVTLIGLKIQAKTKNNFVNLTKQTKYNQIRNYSFIIAGIPGAVLAPFALAAALNTLLPSSNELNDTSTFLMIATLSLLFPGIIAMITLLVLAIITATKKPIDPEAKTPTNLLTQIIITIITAAMPAIAFLDMYSAAATCDTGCNTFTSPVVEIAAIAYLVLWALLATIWLRSRKPTTK